LFICAQGISAIVVLLVMPTALCVQAFLTMTAKKMVYLIEALVMGASLNSKNVRCHLLKENALECPVHTQTHTRENCIL
jgi:hypothetical protein